MTAINEEGTETASSGVATATTPSTRSSIPRDRSEASAACSAITDPNTTSGPASESARWERRSSSGPNPAPSPIVRPSGLVIG